MKVLKFRVSGMMCVMCRDHVKKDAESVQGVLSAEVNLASGILTAVLDGKTDASETAAAIAKSIGDDGYEAEFLAEMISEQNGQADAEDAICGKSVNEICASAAKSDGAGSGAGVCSERQNAERLPTDNSQCSCDNQSERKPAGHAADKEQGTLLNRFIVCSAMAAVAFLSAIVLGAHGFRGALLSGFIGFLTASAGIWMCRARFIAGVRHIFSKSPTMDSLIFAGVSSAFVFSAANLASIACGADPDGRHMYFEACSMILAFVSLGKYIEARCKRRAVSDMGAALRLLPGVAHLVAETGECRDADASKLKKGDLVLVKPGERVPADGVIEEGSAYFDESAVTGESLPAGRQSGDRLFAGTLDKDGAVKMRVSSAGEFTAASRIAAIIESASSAKSPHSRLADRIAARFVPILFAVSLATFVMWIVFGGSFEDAVMHAAAVLLVSCPCALGLAVPMSVLTASSAAAKRGIVFKSAETLELLSDAKAAALDKTGTLTSGEPTIASVEPCGMSVQDFVQALAALEKGSGHPLAEAVQAYSKEMFAVEAACENYEAADIRTFPGLGIEGVLNGKIWRIGSRTFVAEALSAGHEFINEKDSGTALHAVCSECYAGRVLFSDRPKDSANRAVAALRRLGMAPVMLTGDNEKAAFSAAQAAGFCDSEVMHSLLPEGKADAVAKLKDAFGAVMSAGDGINDGPMLASSDIGIAMGGGADLAVEAADVVLMRSDPLDIARACELSKRTVRNMKQSLAWCFLYNILCVPIAAGILAPVGIFFSPVLASAAMSASSICVMLNALRLLRLSAQGTLLSDGASA